MTRRHPAWQVASETRYQKSFVMPEKKVYIDNNDPLLLVIAALIKHGIN
jgi:hypothetical protein